MLLRHQTVSASRSPAPIADPFPQLSIPLGTEAVFSLLKERHRISDDHLEFTRTVFEYLEETFKGDLTGRRILDLGCGSTGSHVDSGSRPRLFEPWLCRGLLIAGAIPVGIDVNPAVAGEDFETHVLNLCKPGCLKPFSSKSYDAVILNGLRGSATFQKLVGHSDKTDHEIGNSLRRDARRLLRPGGVFVHCEY